MKLEFTVEQVNKITQTIDAGLKNTHVGGLNVMEGAVIFAQGVTRAQQQEQNEIKHPTFQSAMADSGAADAGS